MGQKGVFIQEGGRKSVRLLVEDKRVRKGAASGNRQSDLGYTDRELDRQR